MKFNLSQTTDLEIVQLSVLLEPPESSLNRSVPASCYAEAKQSVGKVYGHEQNVQENLVQIWEPPPDGWRIATQ